MYFYAKYGGRDGKIRMAQPYHELFCKLNVPAKFQLNGWRFLLQNWVQISYTEHTYTAS